MKFFLVTTDHLTDRIWFRDEEDFRVAMNYVAVVSSVLSTNVLAFILMSNHVHFVLQCDESEAKLFIDRFKLTYGEWLKRKYDTPEFLRRVKVDIREVKIEDESLHRAIAYVQMNCVAANICPNPFVYPWGTGSTFFNPNETPLTHLRNMSKRKQYSLTRSRVILPNYYAITPAGFIAPSSYVPVEFVEKLFGSAKRFQFFLNTSSKAKKHLEKNAAPSFSDQVLISACKDLCQSLLRKGGLNELTEEQTGEILRQLRRRFSADIAQLCRVTGIPYKKVVDMLEDF